jgi:DNA-binding NarL/FixJ family response regulator
MRQELERQLAAISDAVAGIRMLFAIEEPTEPAAEPLELADLAYREEWTRREREVAALVVRGYRNKEIATEMGIAEQSVKNHLRSMCEKIGASDRGQIAMYAMRLGIR